MKLFLGTPITCLLEENNKFNSENKINLENVIHSLREEHEVFCAIEREAWGDELLSGDVCTLLDYEAMQETEVFIAIPNQSYGVYVEIGWASSLGKPIILLINEDFGIKSPLLEGLYKLANTTIITYSEETNFPSREKWENDLKVKVNECLNQLSLGETKSEDSVYIY